MAGRAIGSSTLTWTINWPPTFYLPTGAITWHRRAILPVSILPVSTPVTDVIEPQLLRSALGR